jgi:hypothetical protein
VVGNVADKRAGKELVGKAADRLVDAAGNVADRVAGKSHYRVADRVMDKRAGSAAGKAGKVAGKVDKVTIKAITRTRRTSSSMPWRS